jgi:drug/metabolite transporter (DMT)-like permease
MVMPIMMVGLALALDVMGATSGLGAAAHWGQIGLGVLFALGASTTFGLAMVLTQYEAGDLDGRLRTFTTMAQVAIWASLASLTGGGWQLPVDAAGWLGLGLLTFFYGTAFTLMFTVLPRLGVVGNSAIMNVEPVFALVLAWAFLNQAIAPVQLLGAAIVVGTVMALGLRKRS